VQPHGPAQLARLELGLRRGVFQPETMRYVPAVEVVERRRHPPAAQRHLGEIDGDAAQPRSESTRLAQAVDAEVRLVQRLLHDILGLAGVAQHGRGQTDRARDADRPGCQTHRGHRAGRHRPDRRRWETSPSTQ